VRASKVVQSRWAAKFAEIKNLRLGCRVTLCGTYPSENRPMYVVGKENLRVCTKFGTALAPALVLSRYRKSKSGIKAVPYPIKSHYQFVTWTEGKAKKEYAKEASYRVIDEFGELEKQINEIIETKGRQ